MTRKRVFTIGLDACIRLAGALPTGDGIEELNAIRHFHYLRVRNAVHLDHNWKTAQLKALFAFHETCWQFVGITRKALAGLGGYDGRFAGQREKGYQRSHLYDQMQLVDELLTGPEMNTLDLARYVWVRDVVVLSLTTENNLVKDREYFQREVITFPNPSADLFSNDGTRWRYKDGEREFLRKLRAQEDRRAIAPVPK